MKLNRLGVWKPFSNFQCWSSFDRTEQNRNWGQDADNNVRKLSSNYLYAICLKPEFLVQFLFLEKQRSLWLNEQRTAVDSKGLTYSSSFHCTQLTLLIWFVKHNANSTATSSTCSSSSMDICVNILKLKRNQHNILMKCCYFLYIFFLTTVLLLQRISW